MIYYKNTTNCGFYSFGHTNYFVLPIASVSGEAFKNGLIDLKTSVLDDLENWKFFYANGENHTFLSDKNQNLKVNGTNLNLWISKLRQGTAENVVE